MQLKQNSDTVRAITAVFVNQLVQPGRWLILGVLLGLLLLLVWLANSVSPWWLLGLIPWALLLGVSIVALTLVRFALGRLRPRQLTASETRAIEAYLEQATRISDRLHTPWPWLLVLVVFDVIRGKESRVIKEVIADSRSLKPEYDAIKRFFA